MTDKEDFDKLVSLGYRLLELNNHLTPVPSGWTEPGFEYEKEFRENTNYGIVGGSEHTAANGKKGKLVFSDFDVKEKIKGEHIIHEDAVLELENVIKKLETYSVYLDKTKNRGAHMGFITNQEIAQGVNNYQSQNCDKLHVDIRTEVGYVVAIAPGYSIERIPEQFTAPIENFEDFMLGLNFETVNEITIKNGTTHHGSLSDTFKTKCHRMIKEMDISAFPEFGTDSVGTHDVISFLVMSQRSLKVPEEEAVEKIMGLLSKINTAKDNPITEDEIHKMYTKDYGGFDEKEKPDAEIFNIALALAEEFDRKDALSQLSEYNKKLETSYNDIKLKEFLRLAAKKIKKKIEHEQSPEETKGPKPQMQSFVIGLELIQQQIQNQNDTEQIIVKVFKNEVPLWTDMNSSTFENLVRVGVQSQFGAIYGSSVYKDGIKNLHAQALLSDIETKQIYKVCAMEDGCLYYNTNDDNGTIYRVSKDGIKQVLDDEPQPIFLKTQNMHAEINRDVFFDNPFAIKIFSKLCRIQSVDKIIFESHVICEFLKNIPIPIIVVLGEQGSAKTSVTNGVKYMVDPEVENSLSMPTDIDDLVVTISKREISSFDNIDVFEKNISDLFCRAVTGTLQSKRKLYTNSDSYDVYLKEKFILNGIVPSIDQPDLVQRSIFYELPRIDESERMTDDDFKERLDGLRSYVVGHALQTIQKAMLILDEVKEETKKKLPRMASFAVWGEAISRVLGNRNNVFLDAYSEQLKSSNLGLSEEYPIIKPLMSLLNDSPVKFERSTSDLFDLVNPEDQWGKRKDIMPKDAKLLGRELKKIVPVLRTMGYELSTRIYNKKDKVFPRGSRVITITRFTENGYF